MNRNAQIIGHVFIFILGAFVVASVLLVGYRAVDNLNTQQCRAQEIEFARDVERAFDTGLTRGKVSTVTFTAPCGASEVCFVERSAIDAADGARGNLAKPTYAVIRSSVEDGEQASVWVKNTGGYTKVDTITKVLPIADFPSTDGATGSEGILCFTGERVVVRLEGKGLSVWVRPDQ